jgi:hypothetical protein
MNLQISQRLLPQGDTTGESILPIIKTMLTSALSFVGVSQDVLEAVIITDDIEFGPSIHKLQNEAGLALSYTNTDMHSAVAKTIANRQDDRLSNSIVILDNIIAQVMTGAQTGEDIQLWDKDSQLCFYILTHEIGHCKDNTLRPSQEDVPPHVKGEFRVRQIARYYGSILMSEFAACAHSATAMTDCLLQEERRTWRTDAKELMGKIRKGVLEYQLDNEKLRDLAFLSAQGFWVILLQHAKIIGSMIGNPELNQTPSPWIAEDSEIEELFAKSARELRKMWSNYPAWSEASNRVFFDLWKSLSLAHGFNFEETVEADGLYLDAKKIFP